MRKNSVAMMLSFSELAWIAVLCGIWFHAKQTGDLNASIENKKTELEKTSADLREAKDHATTLAAAYEDFRSKLNEANAAATQTAAQIKKMNDDLLLNTDNLKEANDRIIALDLELNPFLKIGTAEEFTDAKNKWQVIAQSGVNDPRELLGKMSELQQAQEKLQTSMRQLEAEKQTLADANKKLENALLASRNKDLVTRREVAGLKGDFKSVVFLFDSSSSMNENSGKRKDSRWENAKAVASQWIQYLGPDQCALIVFGGKPQGFPQGGGFVDLTVADEKVKADRIQGMLNFLHDTKPDGPTAMYAAFEQAFEYKKVDTIVLFTDGRPDENTGGPAIWGRTTESEKIIGLCREHKIPVNAVAVGDYFDSKFADFLLDVADVSGGSFMGR